MNQFDQNDATHLFFPLWAEQNIKYKKPTGEICDFKMRPHLVQVADAMDNHKYVIVNKYRQAAITTLTVAYALWEAIWLTGQEIVFVSNTDREAISLCRLMKQFIEHMPEQPVLGKVNPSRCTDHEICFKDVGSRVFFSGPDFGPGRAFSHLYIDEAAFIPDMDRLWQALLPSLQTGEKCTAVSTPNGAHGWFYDAFVRAWDGTNQFFPIRLNWIDESHPEQDKVLLTNLGTKGFLQEMCGVFYPTSLEFNTNIDVKLKELKDKEEFILKVMDEYNNVLKKIEAILQKPVRQELDGKPMYTTPEGIEKYARNLQEMAQFSESNWRRHTRRR